MKGLGEDILTELRKRDTPPTSDNAPVRVRDLKHRTARDIWSEMGSLLHHYGVSVLIIDEVHNVLVRGAAEDYETTAANIKSLVIDEHMADDRRPGRHQGQDGPAHQDGKGTRNARRTRGH